MAISIAQKKKKREKEGEELDPEFWMVTFGDLLSLLITFFVMLFAMSTLDDQLLEEMFISTFTGGAGALSFGGGAAIQPPTPEELVSQRKLELSQLYDFLLDKKRRDDASILEMFEELTQSLLASDVIIKRRGPHFVLTFPSEKMFDRGSAELSPLIQAAIERLGNVLRFSDSDMVIEGHTDDTPVSSRRYASNWELSAVRAARVMDHFIRKTPVGGDRLRAVGYADTRPVAKNWAEEYRARNRRVDIVIRQAPEI